MIDIIKEFKIIFFSKERKRNYLSQDNYLINPLFSDYPSTIWEQCVSGSRLLRILKYVESPLFIILNWIYQDSLHSSHRSRRDRVLESGCRMAARWWVAKSLSRQIVQGKFIRARDLFGKSAVRLAVLAERPNSRLSVHHLLLVFAVDAVAILLAREFFLPESKYRRASAMGPSCGMSRIR